MAVVINRRGIRGIGTAIRFEPGSIIPRGMMDEVELAGDEYPVVRLEDNRVDVIIDGEPGSNVRSTVAGCPERPIDQSPWQQRQQEQ